MNYKLRILIERERGSDLKYYFYIELIRLYTMKYVKITNIKFSNIYIYIYIYLLKSKAKYVPIELNIYL